MSKWVDIRPTEEEKIMGEEWDLPKEEIELGYGIFEFNGTGILEIEQWDCMGTFSRAWDEDDRGTEGSDMLAAKQAEHDGFCKIIPVNELPENFEYRYFGWIDTPENREKIRQYCM